MQHHKYSLTELDHMLPWEREIYIKMLIDHLREEKERKTEKEKKLIESDRSLPMRFTKNINITLGWSN